MTIAVYKITNILNNKFYIGASKDVDTRISTHKMALKKDRHCCQEMQGDYRISPIDFTFEIIEECEGKILNKRERYWIKKLEAVKLGYNMIVPTLKKKKDQRTIDSLELGELNKRLKQIKREAQIKALSFSCKAGANRERKRIKYFEV